MLTPRTDKQRVDVVLDGSNLLTVKAEHGRYVEALFAQSLEIEHAEIWAALESLVNRAHAAGWNSEDANELDFQALRQARAVLAKL